MAPLKTRSVEWAASSYTLPGQTDTGDRHFIADIPEGTFIAVVDGLGHGPEAATAAERAVTAIDQSGQVKSLTDLVKHCHRALRGTRGVVMSLATYDSEKNMMTWLGVGNVIGRLQRYAPSRSNGHENLVLRSGVVGHELPSLRSMSVPVARGDVMVMATDGVDQDFLDCVDPMMHVEQIVETVLANHCKTTDDALVFAIRFR